MIDIHELEEGLLKRDDFAMLKQKKCCCADLCYHYWIVSFILFTVLSVLAVLITLDILNKL